MWKWNRFYRAIIGSQVVELKVNLATDHTIMIFNITNDIE